MLLTIAIPTYNRLEYLKELLPELIKQCKPYPEIEILVSDNCTTDGTFNYIVNMSALNPQMRWRKNEVNVGGDENFVRCVEAAQGEYVWLFGDDELLYECAIETVMNLLKTRTASLVILCGRWWRSAIWSGTYTEFIERTSPETIINHTLITCNIFKKSIFNTRIARERSPDLKGYYAHIYAIVDTLKKQGLVVQSNIPTFKVRPVRAEFIQKVKFTRLKWIPLLFYLKVPYSRIFKFIAVNMIWATIKRQINKVIRVVLP